MWETISNKIIQDIKITNFAEKILAFIPGLILAIIYLIFFWGLWRFIQKYLAIVLQKSKVDETIASFVQEVIKYTLFVMALISALGELGINTVSLMASLGVLGLTIGFAARDTLSNLIAGLFIFWDRPFRAGDLVEIDGYYGKIQQITLRSTRIVTVDGKMVAFPNTTIVSNKVLSYTNFPHLRLDVNFTIGVNEDIAKVRALILDSLQNSHEYLTEPTPKVVLTSVNDFNLAIQIQAWIEDERKHIPLRHALREDIFNLLRDAKIDMPYETFQLAPVKIQKEKEL